MATIQTTQLEERETGDIKQLRDHDIAEGPVSTNSADATSLKSVPMTLEDGSIIKVRFDSLVTAIGQALGASEDSTVTKVLGLNGTVPKGIGMANLASVLGVTYQRVMKSETYTYTLSLGGESSVEIMFFINASGPKCCTYRFYFRDYGDSSYEHFGNNTGASVSVNALGDGVFTFSVSGYSMLYVKKLTGYYSLV